MSNINISTTGISKLLAKLNPDKAAGPDRLKPTEGLESANVAPLYKKGEKSHAANYRPISLTCILCKVFEHVVASNLIRHGCKWPDVRLTARL